MGCRRSELYQLSDKDKEELRERLSRLKPVPAAGSTAVRGVEEFLRRAREALAPA